MENIKKYLPHILFTLYITESIFLGINPYSRDVWYAENVPIWITVGFIVTLYLRGIRFSNTAYILFSILPYLHTIGGHYTFERVPFEWFSDIFSFERNMFDRIGHFTTGFFAYPIIEYVFTRKYVSNKAIAILFGIFAIATLAMTYELIEWQYAVIWGGESGAAFLGSQGDIWDAQKDMLMDTLGAIFVSIIAIFTLKKN